MNFNATHNKSMDVRRKQRLSYQTSLLTFGLCVAGFRPRHLNRWAASLEIERYIFMKVLLFVLLTFIGVSAQTSSSLRQKYSEPISETFKIRPQVLLTVSYAKTGEVCSMLIEPQATWVGYAKLDDTEPLKDKVLNEVLEELAPKNQRGKFLVGTHRGGLLEYYERVDVQRSGQIDKWRYAVIYWKVKACEN